MLATVHVGTLIAMGGVLLAWKVSGQTSLLDLPLLLISTEAGTVRAISLLPRIICVPGHGWAPVLERAKPGAALAPAALFVPVGGYVLLRLLPGTLLLPTVPALSGIALILGLATLWWGALQAWLARDLRQVAAWLGVAQSGYLLVALAAAGNPAAAGNVTRAAALHVLLVPLALVALWCAAASVLARTGTDALAGLSGLLRPMPIEAIAFLVGGLFIAGAPPLPGFWIQRFLISGMLAAGQPALAAVLVLADLLVAVAVIDAFRQVFLRREPPPAMARTSAWLPAQLTLVVAALLAAGIWRAPLIDWSQAVTATALAFSP